MCSIEKFERELRLSKAPQTVKSYSKQFRMFLEFFDGQDVRYLSLDALKGYVVALQDIYGYSSIVHAISAIKFYYKHLNGRKRDIIIPNPPKPHCLPSVLSAAEVKQMIEMTENVKHRALIEVMFYHGLRRAELLNLKAEHIDSANMKVRVFLGKGLKSRDIPLSETCLNTLRVYFKAERPTNYLFNGQQRGSQYSASSLAQVVKQAALRAGITKRVHPHTLRHSFASYLVNQDVSIKKIQEWLGHSSVKTTELYCHLEVQPNPIHL